jgi:hypothetical protein
MLQIFDMLGVVISIIYILERFIKSPFGCLTTIVGFAGLFTVIAIGNGNALWLYISLGVVSGLVSVWGLYQLWNKI